MAAKNPQFAKKIRITPKLAKKWLNLTSAAKDFVQRPVSRSVVKRYVQEILAGNWKYNGKSISLSPEHYVIDGQHRLLAIIEANVAVEMLVAYNVGKDTFDTIDIQYKRSIGHALAVLGETNYNVLGSALGWLYKYRNGKMIMGGSSGRGSHVELLKLFEDEPGVRESIGVTMGVSTEHVMPHGAAVFAHYIFQKQNKTAAADFMEALAFGTGIGRDHPIYVLRRRLLRRHISKTPISVTEMLALTFKVWRLALEGKTVTSKSLRWIQTGTSAEDFPYLDGRKRKRRQSEGAGAKAARKSR